MFSDDAASDGTGAPRGRESHACPEPDGSRRTRRRDTMRDGSMCCGVIGPTDPPRRKQRDRHRQRSGKARERAGVGGATREPILKPCKRPGRISPRGSPCALSVAAAVARASLGKRSLRAALRSARGSGSVFRVWPLSACKRPGQRSPRAAPEPCKRPGRKSPRAPSCACQSRLRSPERASGRLIRATCSAIGSTLSGCSSARWSEGWPMSCQRPPL